MLLIEYLYLIFENFIEIPPQTVNAIDAKDKHLRGTYR